MMRGRANPSRRGLRALVKLLTLAVLVVTAAPPIFGPASERDETGVRAPGPERSHDVLRMPGPGARAAARLAAPDLKVAVPAPLALPVAIAVPASGIGDARRHASIDDRRLGPPLFGPAASPAAPPQAPRMKRAAASAPTATRPPRAAPATTSLGKWTPRASRESSTRPVAGRTSGAVPG